MRYQLVNLIGILMLLSIDPAMALKADRQQPIYIESEELEVDEAHGVSEYRGSVRFSQGSIHLQADKVVVFELQQRLQKVIAYGAPVRLRQLMEEGQGEMRAEADKMEYVVQSDGLFLEGGAKLWEGGNEFSGERIEYHLQSDTVVAHSDKEQEGRVRIVIQPKPGLKEPELSTGANQP
jgi:lipopolysaccharide export system protein LptA